MTYASLVAAGALKMYLIAYRSDQGAGNRAAYAASVVAANFPSVTPQFLARFAAVGQEAALAGNALNQAGESYLPNLYNVPDLTGSQLSAGQRGRPCLAVTYRATYSYLSANSGYQSNDYLETVYVPIGSDKSDIESLAIAKILEDFEEDPKARDYLDDPLDTPTVGIARYYGLSQQICGD